MQKLLVPTDFSATAEKAFRFAADFASRCSAEIVLYHVYTPLKNPFIDTPEKRQQYNNELVETINSKLIDLKNTILKEYPNLNISTALGKPPLSDSVLCCGTDNKIDLIVMGTQGATGLRKKLIGSQATDVLENSAIPVLLIPEKFEWKQPQEIILTTAHKHSDKHAISTLLKIAECYNSKITVLFLYENDDEKNKINDAFYKEVLSITENNPQVQLKHLKTDSITATLENLDVEMPYDMLAMTRTKKSFFERLFFHSFTKDMAYITKKPFFVIPEKD